MKRYPYTLFLPLLALLGGVCGVFTIAHASTITYTASSSDCADGSPCYTGPGLAATTTYQFACPTGITVGAVQENYYGIADFPTTAVGTDGPDTIWSFTVAAPYSSATLWIVPAEIFTTGGQACGEELNFNEVAYVPPPSPTSSVALSFAFPSPGSSPADFLDFKINGTGLPTDGGIYRADVVYSQAGGSVTYDDFNLVNSLYADAGIIVPKTVPLPVGSGWYAQAFWYATSTTEDNLASMDPGDAIASSTLTYFSISEGVTYPTSSTSTGGIFSGSGATSTSCGTVAPFFTFSSGPPYFNIGSIVPSIEVGGCLIFSSVFVLNADQSADINARYQNAATIIGEKPPLGYFTIITNAFSNYGSSTTSTDIMDPSSTAALAPIFSPLDTGLAAAVGLVGGFWLLRRLKHIQP